MALNALAANSMYRITQTILQNYEGRNNLMGEILFKKVKGELVDQKLSVKISDIPSACLTNLQRVL